MPLPGSGNEYPVRIRIYRNGCAAQSLDMEMGSEQPAVQVEMYRTIPSYGSGNGLVFHTIVPGAAVLAATAPPEEVAAPEAVWASEMVLQPWQ